MSNLEEETIVSFKSIGGEEGVTLTLDQFSKGCKDITRALKNSSDEAGCIEETKPYEKYAKAFGEDAACNIVKKSVEELKELIAQDTKEISALKDEMEKNPAYVKAKQDLADLRGAFNDTVKPMKMAINLAVEDLNNWRSEE